MIVEVRVKGDRDPVIPSAERAREMTDAGKHIPLVYTIAEVADVIVMRAQCGFNYALVEVEDLNAASRITDILYGKHYVTSFRTDARYPVVTIAW